MGQKLSIAACALLVAAGMFGFAHWRRETDFRPIYTGMAAEDAGAVVQKLKETGTDYRLSDNGATLLVPSAKLAELRLQLALLGLPKSGRMGFEMFDKTNFGVTDFAEHVNYRRALEGELERSIISLAEVERARVHLTFQKESVYLEARQPAKASVILGLRAGAQLSPQNVMAVCNLLASAVEGLVPEAVSVVDTRGNLLNKPRKSAGDDGLGVSEANLEYRQQVEKDLLAKIQSTLEPVLGTDRFRAAVSADCDFSSGEQSEETFDPSHSVMVSSQKSEDLAPSSALSGGVPGTASNLPRPAARAAGGSSGTSRRSEEVNYQSSRVLRRVRLPLGELKRVSVSLLIDQDVRWEGKPPNLKQVLTPPSPEKLKTIRDLVAGAISFKAERGDQLIVETLPFEATLRSEPPEPPASSVPPAAPASPIEKWMRDPKILIGAAGGVVLLLVLAFITASVAAGLILAEAHWPYRRIRDRAAARQGCSGDDGRRIRGKEDGSSCGRPDGTAGAPGRRGPGLHQVFDFGGQQSGSPHQVFTRESEKGPHFPGTDPAHMAPRKKLGGPGAAATMRRGWRLMR